MYYLFLRKKSDLEAYRDKLLEPTDRNIAAMESLEYQSV